MAHPKIKGNAVGRQIKKARREAGMSQLQLSAALSEDYGIELSEPLISKIESGGRPLRDKELKAIADVLGVTPNMLFGMKK